MRRLILATLVLFAGSALAAQSPAPAQPAAPAKFEVASVKLDAKQGRGGPRQLTELSLPIVRVVPGGRVESYGHTLRNLIRYAYEIDTTFQQVVGKQDVLEMEFVISAKAPGSTVTPAETRAMFRTLLEERFQLRVRPQPRDMDGYLLMPARDDGRPGSALRPFSGDCEARTANSRVPFDSPEYEQNARCGWSGINDRQRAVGQSMATIAERLAMFMVAPVSDRTGWPGRFTFDIVAATNDLPFNASRPVGLGAPLVTDSPRLLDVFRSELGLKLVKDRATVNDLVVERVEALIEN